MKETIGKIKGLITCLLFAGMILLFIQQAGRVIAPPQTADIANLDVSVASSQNIHKSPYADDAAYQHNPGRYAALATMGGE